MTLALKLVWHVLTFSCAKIISIFIGRCYHRFKRNITIISSYPTASMIYISCSHNQVIIKSIWSIIRRYWIGKQDDILPYDYCHAKQWWFVTRNNLLWMFSFANYIDVIFYIDHLECEPLKNLRRVSEHGEPRYMRVYDN